MGRGDRPSHIVNCVCFLSVKASPEAKTPISQIQSGEEGGDDYVDNDEDEVDDNLLDDGHDAVDDSIGKLDISIEGGDLLSVDLFRSGADEV